MTGIKNLKTASEKGLKTIRFCREPQEKTFEPDAEINSFTQLKEAVDTYGSFYVFID